jgi:hypothetical protein
LEIVSGSSMLPHRSMTQAAAAGIRRNDTGPGHVWEQVAAVRDRHPGEIASNRAYNTETNRINFDRVTR